MAIKTIEYDVDIAGISPATEQFAGTQGDHRVAQVRFTVSDSLYNAVQAIADDGKVVYRFDVYDGEGGVWSGDTAELTQKQVDFVLEERHTRHGGKITVYLVISALSSENDTEVELYSFPAVLRLKNKPEGTAKEGENYESVSSLAEVAKRKADEAAESVVKAETEVEKAKNEAETAKESALTATDALANINTAIADSTDQAYDPESTNAQSGVAVAEAVKLKVPMIAESDITYPKAIIVKGGASLQMIDGTLYPADSDYQHLGIDNNYSKIIDPDGVDVTRTKGNIACRDKDTGNLWTGDPVDDEDCVNKAYVDGLVGDIETLLGGI